MGVLSLKLFFQVFFSVALLIPAFGHDKSWVWPTSRTAATAYSGVSVSSLKPNYLKQTSSWHQKEVFLSTEWQMGEKHLSGVKLQLGWPDYQSKQVLFSNMTLFACFEKPLWYELTLKMNLTETICNIARLIFVKLKSF